jgi:regulator of protease activity HflC (stomatin/prohibitin superfamily)
MSGSSSYPYIWGEMMASAPDMIAGFAFEAVLFGLAGLVVQRLCRNVSFLPQRIKLLPFNRGVLLKGETVEKVVEPGSQWILPGRTLVPVDIRPKPFQVPTRELITEDHGVLRVAFGGEYKVIDPASYVKESSDPFGAVFVAMEKVISAAASEFDVETLLASPSMLAERVEELIEPRAAQLGIRIVSLEVSSVISIGWVLNPTES